MSYKFILKYLYNAIELLLWTNYLSCMISNFFHEKSIIDTNEVNFDVK